nr:MAG TPA: Cytochrome C' [Caudoviricetes sp.]
MVKRCYHCGYKLTPNITYSLYNTAIGKVVTVCKDCHTSHLRMRAKQRKKAATQI